MVARTAMATGMLGGVATVFGSIAAATEAASPATQHVDGATLIPAGIALIGIAAVGRFVWWVATDRQKLVGRIETLEREACTCCDCKRHGNHLED